MNREVSVCGPGGSSKDKNCCERRGMPKQEAARIATKPSSKKIESRNEVCLELWYKHFQALALAFIGGAAENGRVERCGLFNSCREQKFRSRAERRAGTTAVRACFLVCFAVISRLVVRAGLVVCWVALTLALCNVLWGCQVFLVPRFVVFSVTRRNGSDSRVASVALDTGRSALVARLSLCCDKNPRRFRLQAHKRNKKNNWVLPMSAANLMRCVLATIETHGNVRGRMSTHWNCAFLAERRFFRVTPPQ